MTPFTSFSDYFASQKSSSTQSEEVRYLKLTIAQRDLLVVAASNGSAPDGMEFNVWEKGTAKRLYVAWATKKNGTYFKAQCFINLNDASDLTLDFGQPGIGSAESTINALKEFIATLEAAAVQTVDESEEIQVAGVIGDDQKMIVPANGIEFTVRRFRCAADEPVLRFAGESARRFRAALETSTYSTMGVYSKGVFAQWIGRQDGYGDDLEMSTWESQLPAFYAILAGVQ